MKWRVVIGLASVALRFQEPFKVRCLALLDSTSNLHCTSSAPRFVHSSRARLKPPLPAIEKPKIASTLALFVSSEFELLVFFASRPMLLKRGSASGPLGFSLTRCPHRPPKYTGHRASRPHCPVPSQPHCLRLGFPTWTNKLNFVFLELLLICCYLA